ncbi:hypothetical protein KVK32_06520 [Helicobacter pylori]|nr:hypothetical protein KVK32_06520 [Helicobacter pylori]
MHCFKRSLNGALGSWLSMERLLERCANASMSSLLGDPQMVCKLSGDPYFFLIKFDHAVF